MTRVYVGLACAAFLFSAACSKEVTSRAPNVPDGGSAIEQNSVRHERVVGLGRTQVVVSSSRPFPVRSALAQLLVGERVFSLSQYDSGSLNTLIFTIPDIVSLSIGAPVVVRYEPAGNTPDWAFGPLPARVDIP